MAKSRKTSEPDPIFAAIAEHKSIRKEWMRLDKEINNIQEAAEGRRPTTLIPWRYYGAIGECEIDRVRDQFLRQPEADPEQIEKEYQDALARYEAAKREAIAWDIRMGIAPLRKQSEQAWRAWEREGKKLARTRPTTPAGTAALIVYIRSFIMEERECGEWQIDDWTMPALKMIAASLAA